MYLGNHHNYHVMRKLVFLFYFLLAATGLSAKGDFPDPINPPRLVNDFTQLFSEQENNALEQKLRTYHDTTSTQIYVVVINDLHGYEIADYATQLAEQWQIGQKGRDNGVLILVKNKVGNERGQVFIATGYGMEGVLPDALAKRIVETEIIPFFQQGQYYKGIDAAINAIISVAAGEYKALPQAQQDGEDTMTGLFVLLILFVLIYIIIRRRKKGGGGTSGGFGTGNFGPFGGFGGFGRGGSGSSSRGRGFGGGGGGRFGGGGAGGSW